MADYHELKNRLTNCLILNFTVQEIEVLKKYMNEFEIYEVLEDAENFINN